MRIGIVTTWFERGAAYVSRMYMKTLSENNEVFIYARGGEEYAIGDPIWDTENVTWGKLVDNPSPTPVNWQDFHRWVNSNQLEIIIFNEQQEWDVILRCAWLLPKIRIGAYIDYYTSTTIPFFKLYDFLICNTKRHYQVFKSHPQSIYIPWGTDIELFRPLKKAMNAKDVVFFHSCGMNHVRKGTNLLVEAFELVNGAASLIIHSQIVIPDRKLRERILQNPRIQLIEQTIGAPGLYTRGDVYVYPTRLEGIGLTIAEALSSGLPVITTDEAPMNEFVLHGINGRLVEVSKKNVSEYRYYWPFSECNIISLANEMQFYVNNIAQIRKFQQGARDYALKNLDWVKNSQNLPELLKKLRITRSHLTIIETMNLIKYDFFLKWGSLGSFLRKIVLISRRKIIRVK